MANVGVSLVAWGYEKLFIITLLVILTLTSTCRLRHCALLENKMTLMVEYWEVF